MRNDPTFDPYFYDTRAGNDGQKTEKKAFLFDGWSYQPLLAASTDKDERVHLPREN
jgi:hypothetical protein